MKLSTFAFGALTLLTLTFPYATFANKDVETKVLRLSDSHVLFTMDFTMGFLNRAAYLPLLIKTAPNSQDALTYKLTDETGAERQVASSGLLLGDPATVTNNRYSTNYGQQADYTLMVIAALPKNSGVTTLTLENLPYYTATKDGELASGTYPKSQMGNFTVTLKD